MSQGQPAKQRSPPAPAPTVCAPAPPPSFAYRPAQAPATHSSLTSPPSSLGPAAALANLSAHQRSPGPSAVGSTALPSVRTNPDLFRPDAFPARLPPTSASASEAYLARAPPAGPGPSNGVAALASGGLVPLAGSSGAGGAYTRLPPIDLSGARSRQGSVVGRSAPPSRATSAEPQTEGEDELSPHGGSRKRMSIEGSNGAGATGTVSGTATPGGGEGVGPNGEGVDWTRTRKDNHKEVERRRRETINDGINDLKQIVPGCDKNKGSILQRSVEYINELKDNEAKMVEKWTLEQLLSKNSLARTRRWVSR